MFKIENITTTIKETYLKIKDFLLKPKSREFFIFLIFMLLSSGFWLLLTLKESYEEDFKIPLVITNIPEDIILTNEPTNKLYVRIKDRGTLLAKYKFTSLTPIELDFELLPTLKEDYIHIPSIGLKKQILANFSNTTSITSIQPDSVKIIFSKGDPKQVPVALQGITASHPDYILTDTVIDPPMISIAAPSYQINDIDTIYTSKVELLNITDTAQLTIPLQSIEGVKFTPSEVKVTIPTDILTEKTVRVPLIGVNFPADRKLRTFPSYAEITFQIGTQEYNSVTSKDFAIHIDYWELRKLDEDTYKVKVTKYPSNIKRMRLTSQDRVDFLIEKTSID